MKINLLKNQNYLQMPWKNGQGFTSEIAIYPIQSTLNENNFTWRLSSAEITENGPFSIFPDCERYLTVIEGHGLKLKFENSSKLVDQNYFVKFSGEDKIQCELISGKVKDLNLIIKKQAHHIQIEIATTSMKGLPYGTSIIFVIEGSVMVKKNKAEKFDTLIVETEQKEDDISILPDADSKFVLITIS